MFQIFFFYYLQRYDVVNGVVEVEAEGVTENDTGLYRLISIDS